MTNQKIKGQEKSRRLGCEQLPLFNSLCQNTLENIIITANFHGLRKILLWFSIVKWKKPPKSHQYLDVKGKTSVIFRFSGQKAYNKVTLIDCVLWIIFLRHSVSWGGFQFCGKRKLTYFQNWNIAFISTAFGHKTQWLKRKYHFRKSENGHCQCNCRGHRKS